MHIPVLLHETINGLAIKKGGTYVDCTVNRGGHSIEIARLIGTQGTLICIDLDQVALSESKSLLTQLPNTPTLHFVHSNFRHLENILKDLGINQVDGLIADLGLSSQELDISGRGFSFRFDEPLHMTFDADPSEDTTTAKEIVNNWSEETIADILFGYADERYAKRIAREIVKSRIGKTINTTTELVDIISSSVPSLYRHRKIHFATKTFQALRMATNDELGSIKDLINSLPTVLHSNGRACIITFHSTEDRLVKQLFKEKSEEFVSITKKPITPSEEELKNNPRSRSAQLRIIERK